MGVIATNVNEAIARIEDWKGKQISYEPLTGGKTNPTYVVTVNDTKYFLKVPGAGTDFIDRENCHMANVIAGETGVGPKVYYYFADTGVEVHEWLEGYSPLRPTEVLDEEIIKKVIKGIQKYHNSGMTLKAHDSVFDKAREMVELSKDNKFTPPYHDRMMALMDMIEDAMNAAGIDEKPCHNDFWYSNWMYNRETGDIKFIDFEYASMTDPYYELTIAPAHSLGEAGDMFINKVYHDGVFDEIGYAKTKLYQIAKDIKWSYWSLYQEISSDVNFDYFGWYAGKIARLQWMWQDPRIDYWLNLLHGRPMFKRP